jgi:N-acetylneuraminic acid mutarotase
MYIFGGRNNQQDLADLWNFDPQTQIWTQIMDAVGFMPTGRQAAAACVHGSNMVLLGGESATTVFSDVFLYNFGSSPLPMNVSIFRSF